MIKIYNNYRLLAACLLPFTVCSLSVNAKSSDKGSDVDISGYVMMGYDSFDSAFVENSAESDDATDLRRARLSLKTTLNEDWKAKFQLDFSGDDTEVKDAYLHYKGWEWADFTIGKQKEPFGLEKLTSSRNTLMIERSIITEAISPGRSIGVNASGNISSVGWQLGYFKPDESESASAVTGRVTWLPWQHDNNLLHIGAAFSERELNGSDYRINEPMEVYLSDSLIEGKKLTADQVSLNGVELLWIKDRFTLMAEWQKASVTNLSNNISNSTVNNDYDYQGGYLQVSYQLSGGHRKYKNGVLGSPSKKGWELTSRYSQFELGQEEEEAKIYSVGLNYSVNKKLKFMADFIHAERSEQGLETDSGNAYSLRAQYSF